MYVCICNAVTERQIRQAVDLGATTFADLREGLAVATDCGKCGGYACDVLNDALADTCLAARWRAARKTRSNRRSRTPVRFPSSFSGR